MEAVPVPLYLNWSFWAVIVSIAALALSQLPPIHILLKKAKIDVELYSKVNLTHKVGNPNLQLHLIISNIGGRKIKIKNIQTKIVRDGNEVANLPAQNFLQNPADKNTVLLTSFSLNPNEEWAHIANFVNYFGREEERKYRELEGKLITDIQEKREKIEGELKELIAAEPENVEPFEAFFTEHFVWLAGEYELSISIKTDNPSANIEKKYRFTMFEYYEEELRKIVEKYKYGSGIYWEPSAPYNVLLEIKEA